MLQDYKLGIRMLLKFPGLTIAGGLALAIAIGVGAGWYDLWGKILSPAIPLPEGDRVVLIETRNTLTNAPEPRVARDFLEWRRELRTIEALGAYRTGTQNLIVGNAVPEPIQMAEVTAAAFRTARVSPLLGRALLDSDERPAAPTVVMLGYDVWQRYFGGRHDVVGSVVKLGKTPATVIGVMPDGFGYPVNQVAWMPLQLRTSYGALEGGAISVIGRLAPGATRERGGRRAQCARAAGRRVASGDARASPAARDATGETLDVRAWRSRVDEPACAAGADHRVHERRHADLREDGDAGRRDRLTIRARREPRSNRRPALRGGPGSRVGGRRGRSHSPPTGR